MTTLEKITLFTIALPYIQYFNNLTLCGKLVYLILHVR